MEDSATQGSSNPSAATGSTQPEQASAPVSIAGTGIEEARVHCKNTLLADPCWDAYEYWHSLGLADQDKLLDKAEKVACDIASSDVALPEQLASSLKELVQLNALGVPASTATSPVGTVFGSLPRSTHSTISFASLASGNRSLHARNSHNSLTSVLSGFSFSDHEGSPNQSVLIPNKAWRNTANVLLSPAPNPKLPATGEPRSI